MKTQQSGSFQENTQYLRISNDDYRSRSTSANEISPSITPSISSIYSSSLLFNKCIAVFLFLPFVLPQSRTQHCFNKETIIQGDVHFGNLKFLFLFDLTGGL